MQVSAGQPFTTSLLNPAGFTGTLGARVEIPVTRGIVAYYQVATYDPTTGLWTITIVAPMEAGDFLLVWRSNDGDPPSYETFVPLTVLAGGVGVGEEWPVVDRDAVRPSVDNVAVLERTRAITEGGDEEVTFDANTRPTATEVESLIDSATDAVLSQLWDAFPTDYYGQVRHAIALYTAILVEKSYFREQSADDLWQSMYAAVLAGVQHGIERRLQHTSLSRGLEPTPLPPLKRSVPAYLFP